MSETLPKNNDSSRTFSAQYHLLRLPFMANATDMNVHPTCTSPPCKVSGRKILAKVVAEFARIQLFDQEV